ncbi:L,D-transpeptidase family protein [Geobacter argillaceus]|uniref:L,D-transpeptidase-like protein n=1 Tax=Geobacter argillaceus TaxID=345631 RepID=A0A562VLX7_9BACT|nr:L,D-transpeptidase family protein [Geobacter argillaceus]TWJ18791.1 L,D-transpeptidase-like protein [Geobacter argillaceus]
MRRVTVLFLAMTILSAIVVYGPLATSEPGPNPQDPAKEDLSRVDFPSQRHIPWTPFFIKPNDTLESLFGSDWPLVARFNRVDRRHVYPGMTIKVPKDISLLKDYSPLPREYEPARRYDKYILVDLTEQWLGAYEHGRLKFSVPAATGKTGFETPTGTYQIDARHQTHTSSLYRTDDDQDQYPMDNAMRFYIAPDNVAYWLHARDLPGKPASHGCIGLFDEEMQNRMYGIPEKPVLMDSQKVYAWAVGEDEYEDDAGELELLEEAPVVEVRGTNPVYRN